MAAESEQTENRMNRHENPMIRNKSSSFIDFTRAKKPNLQSNFDWCALFE